MQWKRTSIDVKAKVIAMKLSDPDLSNRDIAKIVDIADPTVWDIINKDLPQLTAIEKKLAELLVWDVDIMETIQAKKKARLKEEEERVKDTDLDSWENTALKRSQLLQWKATDRTELIVIPQEEQERLLKLL